jgi:multicomponent Na+:H+ antiporter subunit G
MMLLTALAALLLVAGALLLVIAAWGVITLPDALARQHAATKAGTLALALIGLGAAFATMEWAWAWRLALIVGFLLLTLPVASHLLARAAVREGGLEAQADAAPRVGD